MARLCNPKIEYFDLIANLKLWMPNMLGAQSYLKALGKTKNKKIAVINVKKQINKASPLDILLYTDKFYKYYKIGNPTEIRAT